MVLKPTMITMDIFGDYNYYVGLAAIEQAWEWRVAASAAAFARNGSLRQKQIIICPQISMKFHVRKHNTIIMRIFGWLAEVNQVLDFHEKLSRLNMKWCFSGNGPRAWNNLKPNKWWWWMANEGMCLSFSREHTRILHIELIQLHNIRLHRVSRQFIYDLGGTFVAYRILIGEKQHLNIAISH